MPPNEDNGIRQGRWGAKQHTHKGRKVCVGQTSKPSPKGSQSLAAASCPIRRLFARPSKCGFDTRLTSSFWGIRRGQGVAAMRRISTIDFCTQTEALRAKALPPRPHQCTALRSKELGAVCGGRTTPLPLLLPPFRCSYPPPSSFASCPGGSRRQPVDPSRKRGWH